MWICFIEGCIAVIASIAFGRSRDVRWLYGAIVAMVICLMSMFPILGLGDWEVGETKELVPIAEKIYIIEDDNLCYYSFKNEEGNLVYESIDTFSVKECKVIEKEGEIPKIIKMQRRAIGEPWIGDLRVAYSGAAKVIFIVPPDSIQKY